MVCTNSRRQMWFNWFIEVKRLPFNSQSSGTLRSNQSIPEKAEFKTEDIMVTELDLINETVGYVGSSNFTADTERPTHWSTEMFYLLVGLIFMWGFRPQWQEVKTHFNLKNPRPQTGHYVDYSLLRTILPPLRGDLCPYNIKRLFGASRNK